MTPYATLADVRQELNADSTVGDAEVMRRLRQVSARIDGMFHVPNLFVPSLGAREIPLSAGNISSVNRTLTLRTDEGGVSPLLSLTGVGIGNRTLTVGSTVNIYPTGSVPAYALQLACCQDLTWYGYCTSASSATITGVWGYHTDYAHAWLAVDVLTANLSDSAITFTVADVDGENGYAETPRISAGHLIQIDDEWMDVVKTNTVTNTVTVRRGVNGSTAAAHTSGAAVSVFLVEEDIRRAVARQTAFQYSRRGAYETRRVQDLTAVDYPSDLLAEVKGLLQTFANL